MTSIADNQPSREPERQAQAPRTPAPQTPAQHISAERNPSPLLPARHRESGRFAFAAQLGPVLGLLGIVFLFSILRWNTFATVGNAQIILMQTAVVGTAALGATIVIISGGIDLSVGSLIALTSVAVALLLQAGWWPILAALGGVMVGCLSGFLTGVVITELGLMPFIVTLGTLAALRGLTEKIGNEQTVLAPDTWLNTLIRMLGPHRQWMLVAPGVWITIVLAGLVALGLRYTRFGRHVFAIGSNEQTARLCGIGVGKTKILVYMLGGLFAGLAGVMQFSSLTVGDSTTANGMELDVIAAVVIGGASLNGGQGSIFGTLVGALIMSTVANGCAKMGMGNPVQKMVTGGIIVLAVALDHFQHRRLARGA
ncbi:MAG TPA: ABC transporter permease [Tepidisphaeraceae bacterium]|nr:ABC transporter permease [Tepidisphaeraceae bacterium]